MVLRPLQSLFALAFYGIGVVVLRLAENAVTDWINSQLAAFFGIKSPAPGEVVGAMWTWGMPAAVVVVLLYGYHWLWSHHWHKADGSALVSRPVEIEFVELREACRIAYERLRAAHSIYATAAEKLGHQGKGETREDAILNWLAYSITRKAPIYATHPPSTLKEVVHIDEFNRSGIRFDSLYYHGEKEPRYINLEIGKDDLERVIEDLKNARVDAALERAPGTTWIVPSRESVERPRYGPPKEASSIDISNVSNEKLGDMMIALSKKIRGFASSRLGHFSSHDILSTFMSEYAPSFFWLYYEFKTRRLPIEEPLLQATYDDPGRLLSSSHISDLADRLAKFGSVVRIHA